MFLSTTYSLIVPFHFQVSTISLIVQDMSLDRHFRTRCTLACHTSPWANSTQNFSKNFALTWACVDLSLSKIIAWMVTVSEVHNLCIYSQTDWPNLSNVISIETHIYWWYNSSTVIRPGLASNFIPFFFLSLLVLQV